MAEKKETKAVREKKVKTEKKVSAKKLPKLLKKSYSEKAFEKKINSKIYVPEDKTYITSLFKPSKDKKGNKILVIPAESEFTKKEIKRLTLIAKDIKNNRSRIKAGSFIAVAVLIAAVGFAVTVFKNPVAKMVIRSSMQGIFGAKCDIGSVKIEFFDSELTVTNLAQASSSDYMKNVFQFDRLNLKFNLAQLLRGRFDAENIEITGIETGTERTVSGELPVKPKTAKEKEEKSDSTGFYESLKAKCGTDTDAAKNAFTELFAMYDPSAISTNLKENMQTPAAAKEVEEELKALVETWKNKPAELQNNVEDLKKATAKFTSLNVANVKTPADAVALIKEIDEATKSVNSAKQNMTSSLKSFDSDKAKVAALQKKLNDAMANDKNLLSDQLSVLDVNKSKALISDTINQAGYSLLGQYYPYLKQLIAYASSMKGSDKPDSKEAKESVKKAKTTAKKESKRYAGRYVYWKADKTPRFLIEKAHGSGSGLDILATNISSDMNKRGEPWIVKGVYTEKKRTHNASLVVDSRSNSTVPLVTGTYSGTSFPLKMDLSKQVKAEGVPVFDGVADISAKLTADSDFSFSGSGSVKMNPVKVSAEPLKAETAARIYSEALESINSLSLAATVGFSATNGVDMKVNTDFDKVLAQAITAVANKEMAGVKKEAMAKINEQISASSAGTDALFSQFSGISSQFDSSKSAVDNINSILEAKKKELEQKSNEAAVKAATGAAKSAASNAAGSLLKGLKK